MKAATTIALIQGSIRENRYNDVIAGWVADRLHGEGFNTVRVDPVAPDLLPLQSGSGLAARALRDLLAPVEGAVIVTPEINHAYPGALKTLLDEIGDELAAKPVGFVSYGDESGGLRAVEALRPILSQLETTTLRDTVSFAHPRQRFGIDGELSDPADLRQMNEAMSQLSGRLRWWCEALTPARSRMPLPEMA
ncbi:NADPH-dependent FMN reductase [Pelagovum pacificum]|uniref:NAD(P)H-dependent oxidoreductase n=1 Tax=Pelagovum pacificum TaxID=2588711 RepID=A0A5C5GD41_9RHOB|nr:NAD(P)H-dependent oxidoreductase [Pelagovum pacificum]QQA42365.1 NAD(P)H-dependent oxidoreductase [Pelagovum pacificum]TNY31449.1 NAD(P)H-dependent oxidoreductase [Pelagovum pacificum]